VSATATLDGFVHRFEPPDGGDDRVLLLLHGTGGDENDLVPVGRLLSDSAGVLSPRGKVLENGMPRYFRRLAEGVFDLEDLRFRTHELAAFVAAARRAYGLEDARMIAVGFSNGANIGASLLLLEPRVLAGAILLRPMVPLVPDPLPKLDGTPVFIAAGRTDAMVRAEETARLATLLGDVGAKVDLHWSEGGHSLEREEVEIAGEWLVRAIAPKSRSK